MKFCDKMTKIISGRYEFFSGKSGVKNFMDKNIPVCNDLEINSELLKILLRDMTTGKNILWATDDYKNIFCDEEITIDRLHLIQPRFKKIREQQKNRTRDRAEIFTPSRLCNEQNNLIDEAWFGRKNVFNVVDFEKQTWRATPGKIFFDNGRTWKDYVSANRLEITCGEAPYLVSRYDTVSGEKIPVENRIGLLDRKLRAVFENTSGKSDWLEWTTTAVKSIYGYEFQGDNLFIARMNILKSVVEHFRYKFSGELPDENFLCELAGIISWNLWQMDGLQGIVPYSDIEKKKENTVLSFCEEPNQNFDDDKKSEPEENFKKYCKIKDWNTGKERFFVNLGARENDKS